MAWEDFCHRNTCDQMMVSAKSWPPGLDIGETLPHAHCGPIGLTKITYNVAFDAIKDK